MFILGCGLDVAPGQGDDILHLVQGNNVCFNHVPTSLLEDYVHF